MEQFIEQNFQRDTTEALQREMVTNGGLSEATMGKFGIQPFMVEEATQHYEDATDKMLAPIGSCAAYMQEFLNDQEAARARAAIMGKDMATVRELGERAKQRAASMRTAEVAKFLSTEEKVKLRLIDRNGIPLITLPNGETVTWGSAVTNGWINFNG